MKISSYFFISLFAVTAGAFFAALHYEWIVIRIPIQKIEEKNLPVHKKNERKKVTLHFWHHNTWHTETTDILASEDTGQTVEHLVQAWLTTLEEEATEKKMPLQAVLVSASGIAYVSFARNPFCQEESSWEKLMWVEGLLKTIHGNIKSIQQVQLLVNHKPAQDQHLDFSAPWPVAGFLG